MEELKELWQEVDTYNSHLKYRFNLCAAYLWSIHDYLAYGKFVGWCVHGRLNCPVCMDKSDAFRLQHGRKVSFFDYHQIFLPLSHEFRGDKESFQKGESIRKGPPKQKLRVIRRILPIQSASQCTRRSLDPTLQWITGITIFLFQFRIQILTQS
jgi:hypothetical protein